MRLRQILPLLLCYADDQDPTQGRTRLQKIVFLSQMELRTELYRFEPADYGPFSWQLSKDVDLLVSSGYLTQRTRSILDGGEKFEYSITDSGRGFVEKVVSDPNTPRTVTRFLPVLERLKSQNNRRNLRLLLREVYSKYPEYAVKSRAAL